MKKMYETAMINRGGRDGEVEAPNGSMHMKIDRPGIHSEGTNPGTKRYIKSNPSRK